MKFIQESTNSNILNILFLSFIPLTFFVRDIGNICLIALLLFSVYHIVFKEFRLDEQEIFILVSILFFTLCIIFLSIYHLAPMHEIDHYLRAILLFPLYLLMRNYKITISKLKYVFFIAIMLASILFAIHLFRYTPEIRFLGSSSVAITYGNMLMTLALYLFIIYDNKQSFFNKITLIFMITLCLYLAFQTETRGSLIGLIFTLPFIIYFNKKNKLTLLLIVFISFFVSTITPMGDRLSTLINSVKTIDTNNITNSTKENISTNERIFYYKFAYNKTKEHPLSGIGPQNIKESISKDIENKKLNITLHDHVHNEFLDISIKYGLISLLAMLFMFVYITYVFLKDNTIYGQLGVITIVSNLGYMMTQSQFAHHQAIVFLFFMVYLFLSQLKDRIKI